MNNIHLFFALIILVIFMYIIFSNNANTPNNIKEHLSSASTITQNSPVTSSRGECPPLIPCYTGDYVFQENGTVKKKNNKFTYESTGNVDFFDYYYYMLLIVFLI